LKCCYVQFTLKNTWKKSKHLDENLNDNIVQIDNFYNNVVLKENSKKNESISGEGFGSQIDMRKEWSTKTLNVYFGNKRKRQRCLVPVRHYNDCVILLAFSIGFDYRVVPMLDPEIEYISFFYIM